jgi:hypothetical protein
VTRRAAIAPIIGPIVLLSQTSPAAVATGHQVEGGPAMNMLRQSSRRTAGLRYGPQQLGAIPVGALAIGRLAIGRAVVRRLKLGELEVQRLRVHELRIDQQRTAA